MGKKKYLEESLRVTLWVSSHSSPRLYKKLKGELADGEGRGPVLRRLAEDALFQEELRRSNGLQLVDSQQVFQNNFINQSAKVMKINEDTRPEAQNSSLTKKLVNEELEPPNAAQTEESGPSKPFINQPPPVMKKKSGSAEMAKYMVEMGLMP